MIDVGRFRYLYPGHRIDHGMLKQNAPQPGLDALVKIAVGLGVSLDWLLLGEEVHAISQGALVRLATRAAATPFLQNLVLTMEHFKAQPELFESVFGNGKLIGQTPEQLAVDIANEAGRRAELVSLRPVRSQTMRELEVAALSKDQA